MIKYGVVGEVGTETAELLPAAMLSPVKDWALPPLADAVLVNNPIPVPAKLSGKEGIPISPLVEEDSDIP